MQRSRRGEPPAMCRSSFPPSSGRWPTWKAWPKLTAPQWEQVRRLIAEIDRNGSSVDENAEQRASPRRSVAFPVRLIFDRTAPAEGACWAVTVSQ